MKHIYSRLLSVVLPALLIFSFTDSYGQLCPVGVLPGTRAYDTTISFPAGTSALQVKFPQFDPLEGQVTCMRMCVTMGGVVTLLSFENTDVSSSHTYSATYGRTDFLSGPGISGTLINSVNKPYTFNLQASDNGGIANDAGPDYGAVVNDTVVGAPACHEINSQAGLSPFYGTDSVAYTYNVSGGLAIDVGTNANIKIVSSGFVRFSFQYCTCPAIALPLSVSKFTAEKIAADKAELKWAGFDQSNADYHYEAEVSKNPYNSFTSIGSFSANREGQDDYRTVYRTSNLESGNFYFRIKQIYDNGYVRYTDVRKVTLESSGLPKFSIYPNPSNGIVGIKFDNNSTGFYNVQIFNTQGQLLFTKDIISTGNASVKVTTMKTGAYMIRVVDTKTRLSCVNQLLIK
jgi:hypothetical protein